MQTPESIVKHAADYKQDAWMQYTAEELSWWVKLLAKRAGHRQPGEKRDRDLYDAKNYLAMYKSHIGDFASAAYDELKSLVESVV